MRAVSDAKKYYNNKVSAFSVENFNSSTGQIVFVGDSITDLYKLDSYYADLDLASYNRGIGGDTTQGVIDRLNVSIFDIMPSKIVLMIGTNDVNGNVQNEKILSNYRIIFDEIKKNQPTVDVFVMSIIPQNKDIEKAAGIDVTKNNKTIKYLNSEIKNLCGEYGYSFLEIYDLLLDEEGYLDKEYSDDGLHLNAAGFEIWTEVLKPYLMK
jgi:lysophospholipase L1-like esterase